MINDLSSVVFSSSFVEYVSAHSSIITTDDVSSSTICVKAKLRSFRIVVAVSGRS